MRNSTKTKESMSERKTSKYPCLECRKICERYDDKESERAWRHGDVVFFPCYINCRRPCIKCGNEIYVVTAPWARPGSRYTLLFESYAMLLAINQAKSLLRVSRTSLSNIVRYWVYKAVKENDLSSVRETCVPVEYSRWYRLLMKCTDAISMRNQRVYLIS